MSAQESTVLTTVVRQQATPALAERLARIGAVGVRLIAKGYAPDGYRDAYDALAAAGAAVVPGFRVIVDLPGGKPRISSLVDDFAVERGMRLLLHAERDAPPQGRHAVATVGLLAFARQIRVGDRLFVSDGTIETKVVAVAEAAIVVEVQSDRAVVTASRSINLPDSGVRYPSRGDDDRVLDAFEPGRALHVAVSMTASAADVQRVRAVLPNAHVIAKVESAAGLANLAAIADVADELLIARGDLSVEVPPAELGEATRRIAAAADAAGKPFVLAAGFLDTLQHLARPSIAEMSDLWQQHEHGVSTFMLSGTVCVTHPLEATRWACALLSSFDDRRTAPRHVVRYGHAGD